MSSVTFVVLRGGAVDVNYGTKIDCIAEPRFLLRAPSLALLLKKKCREWPSIFGSVRLVTKKTTGTVLTEYMSARTA